MASTRKAAVTEAKAALEEVIWSAALAAKELKEFWAQTEQEAVRQQAAAHSLELRLRAALAQMDNPPVNTQAARRALT